jgi:uracil-DNA glycosylase family 4
MFVKTTGPPGAKIMLIGEAPGVEEDRSGKPFIGYAGRTLDKLLYQAGINRRECLVTNIAREKPPGNKMEFYYEDSKKTRPKPILLEWLKLLKEEIEMYRPNLIVTLGATPLWEVCGLKGIRNYRGYITESTLAPGFKVLPTWHPQKINYEWKLHFDVIMDLRKAAQNCDTPELPKDNRRLQSSPSLQEYLDYLEYLDKDHEGYIAVDIESTPGAHIDIMGIADSPEHAMSLRILSGNNPIYSRENELKFWQGIARVFSHKPIIMHNGSYDAAVLWYHNGIACPNYDADTMIATHICWPETQRSLGYLTSICLNVAAWKHLSTEMPTYYNCLDAVNTYGCWEVMTKELTKMDAWDTYKFEMSQVEPAIFLQLQGIYVNKEIQQQMLADLNRREIELDDYLEQEIGKKINFNSSQQVKDLLYIDLGLPAQYKRRKSVSETRKITTDAEALTKLAMTTNNPVLLKIIEKKKISKLKGTFIDITISPESRVHTSYNVTGATMSRMTKTTVVDDEDSYKSFGRWSSSKSIIVPYGSGNLQNIPKAARKIYTVPKGYLLLQADYMQAEAVVVAYLSNDQKEIILFEASFGQTKKFREEHNLDVHKLKAAQMFGIQAGEVTSDQRDIGKAIKHARNYDAGPGVLANKIKCTMTVAKKLLAIDTSITPQLTLWHNRIVDELRNTRYLTNLLGRKHKFLDRWPQDGKSGRLFRSAYAYIPQSTVGDLLNRSLVKVYKEQGHQGLHLNLYIQLHDAIYVFTEDSSQKIEEAKETLRECMLYPLKANNREFTIDVDFKIGPSWGEMKEI